MDGAGRSAEGRQYRGSTSRLDLHGELARLHEVVPLEPKPGVPPSSGYLAEVLQKLQATPAKFAIRAAYEDDRPSAFISERAGIPAVVLPFTVGGTDQAKDLFSLYEDTISRLLAGLKK